jgi:lambda family phage portal protein
MFNFFWKKKDKRDPANQAWLAAYATAIKAKYDAAQTTVENERYWANSDNRSAVAAASPTVRARIRNRARYEAVESGSFARGMVLSKTADIIGRGVPIRFHTTSEEFNSQAELRWQEWARSVNLWGKLRTFTMAWIIDGEAFAERITNRRLNPMGVQLDLRILEADIWTDPNDTGVDPLYTDGILYDDQENPISYTRLTHHPGDMIADIETVRIDAENVIHLFRAERPGQRRGVSQLATALSSLAELRRYRLATIAAAEIAANYSAVMYSDANWFSDTPDEITEDFMKIELERRAMLTLPAGWKIEQLKAQQPTAGFDNFCDHYLQEIGRCTQTPLNIISGSSQNYNFASGRLDYLLYWNSNDIDRADVEVCVLERIFSWWLDEALLVADYLPPLGADLATLGDTVVVPHTFQFPPRQPIDIEAQAKADDVYFHLGLLTDDQFLNRTGGDVEQHYIDLQNMIERRTAISAPLPGIVNPQGATNAPA